MTTNISIDAAKRYTRSVKARRFSLKDLVTSKVKYHLDTTSLERKFLDAIDASPEISKDGIGYHLVNEDLFGEFPILAFRGRIFVRQDIEEFLAKNEHLAKLDSLLHHALQHVRQYLSGDLTSIGDKHICWKGKKIIVSSMSSEEFGELEFVQEAAELQKLYDSGKLYATEHSESEASETKEES